MRRAERPPRDQRPLGRKDAGDRVDAHHLERLARLERRQDRGQPSAEHRLPRSRRAGEQQVVAAGRRELERTSRALLAAHVGEIGRIRLGAPRRAARPVAASARHAGTRPPRARWRTGTASTPPSSASQADSGAQRIRSSPARRAPSATANAPRTGRTRPSSASSPTAACSASRSTGSCRDAASTASAIERSKPDPSFRRPAGARLTVIRFSGHSSCAEPMPLRTRCLASAQARSASPTIAKPGRPPSMCASTSTRRGSMPTRAWVTERASTPARLRRRQRPKLTIQRQISIDS